MLDKLTYYLILSFSCTSYHMSFLIWKEDILNEYYLKQQNINNSLQNKWKTKSKIKIFDSKQSKKQI